MKRFIKGTRRMVALVLSIGMVASVMTACGTKTDSAATSTDSTASTVAVGSTTAASALKEVTLKFFLSGDDRTAKNEVLEALYEQTKDRLNAKFEFNFVPGADYANKLTMMQAAGDNYDASYTADWNVYPIMSNKGGYLPLNDLLAKYAPTTLKEYQDGGMVDPISIDGQIMALPWTLVKTSKPVFAYRKDIAAKLNLPATDVSTIEGIDQLLTAAKKADLGGLVGFDMAISGGGARGDIAALLSPKYEYYDMGFHSMYVDLNDSKVTVMPLEQTDMFKEAVTLAKKWYDAGIISKDALTNKENEQFRNAKAFSCKNTNGMLYEVTAFTDKTAEKTVTEIYPDNKFMKDSPLNNAMAINKNAANPERTMMFFELINTDEAVYNTLVYGIKDKTYSVGTDGVIGFAAGEDVSKPTWQNYCAWGFWRDKFLKPTALISAEAWKQEKAYAMRTNIVVAPTTGLVPVTDAIKTEIAKRDQLIEESGKLLLAGIVNGDIDKAINTYIQQQKDAGLDKILADVQAQVDAYTSKK